MNASVIPSFLTGYNPRCRIFQRKRNSGSTMYYLDYFLPNNIRVRRPCHTVKTQANALRDIKNQQLLQGVFDETDKEKMPEFQFEARTPKRYELMKGLKLYLNTTASERKEKTQYNDTKTLTLLFDYFTEEGKKYLDELTPLDIQQMFNYMALQGRAEATIALYARLLKRLFNWYIHDMELLDIKNPVMKAKIPKKDGLIRDRLIKRDEIQALLTCHFPPRKKTHLDVQTIIAFLTYTGCRFGEAMHAEWEDFDLEVGVWRIRKKPKCPTIHRLGWSPKREKARDVYLLPEALEILKHLPRYDDVYGKVRKKNQAGEVIGHDLYPANFIFPKREVLRNSGDIIYTRVDSINDSWRVLKKQAGVFDIQIKDIRTFFNWMLTHEYGLSSKDAGLYIGNSEQVNHDHYTPSDETFIRSKLRSKSFTELLHKKPEKRSTVKRKVKSERKSKPGPKQRNNKKVLL